MVSSLTFITLRANSTDNNLMVFFFLKTGFDISCKLSLGDSLHEMSNPVFWNKSEKYFKMLSVDFFFYLTVQLACVIFISVNI